MQPTIVTNLYPSHIRFEPMRSALEPAGYRFVAIADKVGETLTYTGPAVAQFVFNYPISAELVRIILDRCNAGEPAVVMMDDPLAFFDENINPLMLPVLRAAARVLTSTDNMLPIYAASGIKAEVICGLANPQFWVDGPPDEADMQFDWGFVGTLIPQRYRFFWELEQLLPDLRRYYVTGGFDAPQVKARVRQTRCNIAYGNFSDLVDFKSTGTTFRSWEFPYAWAFLIQDDRPLLHQYFRAGESMVTFHTVQECAALVRHYVNLSQERRRIAGEARTVIDRYRMTDLLPALFRAVHNATGS